MKAGKVSCKEDHRTAGDLIIEIGAEESCLPFFDIREQKIGGTADLNLALDFLDNQDHYRLAQRQFSRYNVKTEGKEINRRVYSAIYQLFAEKVIIDGLCWKTGDGKIAIGKHRILVQFIKEIVEKAAGKQYSEREMDLSIKDFFK